MSSERKVQLYEQHNCYNLTWTIQGWCNARVGVLKSSQFSTNEEVWQLDIPFKDANTGPTHFVKISVCSATDSFWHVLGEISIVISDRKYLTQKRNCRVGKGQQAELWNADRQSVLDLLVQKGANVYVLPLEINTETWKEDPIEMTDCPEVKPLYNLNIHGCCHLQMAKMLTNQTLTDVTLHVKDKEFKAHKVVLAAASPVFEAMFKEGTKEHEDNYVNIEDIDSDVFDVFLRFIYSGQVDHLDEMCLDLLVAADKYDVQPLKEICVQHMTKNISVENAVDVLALAGLYDVEPIKLQAQKFITNNMAGVMKTKSWNTLLGMYSKVTKQVGGNGPLKK